MLSRRAFRDGDGRDKVASDAISNVPLFREQCESLHH